MLCPPTIASNPQSPIVNVEQSCGPALVTPIVPLLQAPVASNSKLVHRPERKFNIVIYGIQECAKGTIRNLRQQSDLANTVQVLSKAIESVRDCYHLGKYTQSDRPGPLVAVLNRTTDVSEILANRGNLRHLYYVHPEERAVESLLLKERSSLITSGMDRKDICISKNRIYIKHELVGVVKGSRLFRQSEETSKPSVSHQEQLADENENSCTSLVSKLHQSFTFVPP